MTFMMGESEEDKMKLDFMITKIEEFFVGESYEAYKSYKFLLQKNKNHQKS